MNKPFPFSVCKECCSTGTGNITDESIEEIKKEIINKLDEHYATKEEVGNIETVLDSIIAIQNSLIGGESV